MFKSVHAIHSTPFAYYVNPLRTRKTKNVRMDGLTPFQRLDKIREDFFSDLGSAQAFAKKLGVSKQTWSTWKGERGLSKQAVPSIIEILRGSGVVVTTDYLLLGRPPNPYKGSSQPPKHDDIHICKVIEMMESADLDGRMAAYSAVRETLREQARHHVIHPPRKVHL